MIAVAIIGITFVSLIGAQSRSLSIATASRFDTMATFLAQKQAAVILVTPYEEVDNDSGDFGEAFC